MPSIPWSKRPAFGRQTSEPSDQLGVETAPEDVSPPSDGSPGGVPDQTHPRRGSKRGFIQSLLGRAQSHSRSKGPAGPNTTSERKWESSAPKPGRSPGASGRDRAKTVGAGASRSRSSTKKARAASTSAVSEPISRSIPAIRPFSQAPSLSPSPAPSLSCHPVTRSPLALRYFDHPWAPLPP